MGKFLNISIFILLASILIYKSVDIHKYDEFILSGSGKFLNLLLDIDLFFKAFHINGFYRGVENVLTKLSCYMTNKANLNIERKIFDGVNVILFSPIQYEKNRPAILYFHGGGWSLFNPDFYSPFLANLTRQLNTLIVAVDYRKAPEHPYPVAFNDALAATKYFLINSERFDVNPSRIALMGDSAGGNLVVAVGYHLAALKKLHKNIRVPKVLIPLNPTLQMVDINTPSFRDNVHDPILTKANMVKYICMYAFGQLSRSDLNSCKSVMMSNSHLSVEAFQKVKDNVDWTRYLTGRGYDNRPKSSFTHKPNQFSQRLSELVADPAFSPLSALNDTQLQVLPPVYVFGSAKDPLRDDAKIFVARLNKQRSLGDYREFEYYHVSFLLSKVSMKNGEKDLKMLIGLFEKNAIL